MRTALQSLLARHPVVVAGGVALRWLAWLLIGHPFGVVTAIFGIAVGLSLPVVIGSLVMVEAALAGWGMAAMTTGARSVFLWSQLCRFRRLWPSRFAEAYPTRQTVPVVGRNYYSVPGGLRPVMFAPRLSLVPRAFSHEIIGWVLAPRAAHEADELATAVQKIARADDRIGQVQLREVRGDRLALFVRFERPGFGRSSRLGGGLGDIQDLGDIGGLDGGGDDGGDGGDGPGGDHNSQHRGPRADDPPVLSSSSPARPNGNDGAPGIDADAGDTAIVGDRPGGTSPYRRRIPGLQRVRLNEVPDRVSSSLPLAASEVAPAVPTSPPVGESPVQPTRPPTGNVIPGPWPAMPDPAPAPIVSGNRRSLKWSFSVIVPANLILGLVVWIRGPSAITVAALCAAAAVSIILIIAEEVGAG